MNFPHFFGEMSRGIIFSELQGVSFKLAFLQQQQARFNDEAKWLLYHFERIIERSLKKNSWRCTQEIVRIDGGQWTNFSNEVCLHSLCVALYFKL